MPRLISVVESVTRKDTSKGTVYEVELADGQKVATFDDELGELAEELEGQPVKLEVNKVTKGQYTNLYLESIEATDGNAKPAAKKTAPAKKTTTPATGKEGSDDYIAWRIARTSGLRMAVDIAIAQESFNDPDEDLYASADIFAGYIVTGEHPSN